MRKLITLFLSAIVSLTMVYAGGGWATSAVSVSKDGGTAYFYRLNNEGWTNGNWGSNTLFNTYDFGTPTSLVLNGGGGNAWTDDSPGHDATSFVIYYRVYKDGTVAGSWSNVVLNNQTYKSGNDYVYQKTDANIDILALASSPGAYTFEVVMSKKQMWSNGSWTSMIPGGQETAYNAATAGYKAKFSVHAEDPYVALTAPNHSYLGDIVSLSASPSNVENPVITYSVKVPGASTFTAITLPYTATVTGNHTFKVDVTEDGSGPILASDEKDVMVYAKIVGGSKFYLTPNANWKQASARFAMHYLGDGENTAWADFVEVEPDVYVAVTPAGNWTTIIYARMSSGTTENNWDNRWNQTSNLKYDGVNNHYTVTGNSWTDGTGDWSVYVEQPTVNFSNLNAYAFEGDQITLSATSNNVENPVYTYSVKAPAAESFVPVTSPYSPSATGVYTFKVEVAENGDATVLASAEKAVTVMTLPTPITITVKVPDSWENTHFWYWTTFDGLGGWVEPTLLTNTLEDGAKVYRYTFTRFDELNFLVADGNDWGAAPVQTMNTLDVQEKSCYLVDDNPDSETGKYGITKVACDMLLTSVEKTEQAPLTVRVHNKTIELNSEKQASVELYSITGQLIRSAQNVHSFTQKVNSGVYVLRIDGKARKVIVND